jgi:hypothetical protein
MKELIEINSINIKNNKFGLVILNDSEFSNPYRIAIYSTQLEYYEYFEQKSSHGLKTILFPLKKLTTYTIAVHDLHHKLLVLKYYKDSQLKESMIFPTPTESGDKKDKKDKEDKEDSKSIDDIFRKATEALEDELEDEEMEKLVVEYAKKMKNTEVDDILKSY